MSPNIVKLKTTFSFYRKVWYTLCMPFFEGDDFKNKDFKALTPKYYPSKYQDYIKKETALLKTKLNGANKVLEAGVGIGRLIPEIAPIVSEFVGIDNADLMLRESKEIAKAFPNVTIQNTNFEELSLSFPPDYFDYSLLVWNTLGNVKDEVVVLKELATVTSKSIFVTVYLKGTIEDRKGWYEAVDVEIERIDEDKEIFYTKSGLKSRSYNLEDIEELSKQSDLTIIDHKILAGVILWVELAKI